jgi:gluconate 2-dehydrogenase alpha chain
VGLQSRERNQAPLRRRAHSEGLDCGGLATGLEELEPYYDKVEYEVGISGQAGNIAGVIDKRGNIFEGARAREYPMPALTGSEFTEHMAATARKLNWHPFSGPAAVNSQPYDNRPACLYHGFCNRGGCHVNAKNSTAVSTISEGSRDRAAQCSDPGNRHPRRRR